MSTDTFVIAATGDAIVTDPSLDEHRGDSQFDAVVSALRGADAAVTNFETPVPDVDRPPANEGGLLHLRSPPAVVDDLVETGLTLASGATNHAYDYTHEGVLDTMAAFESGGLTYAGIGRTLEDARRPAYRQTPAGCVGLVSATTSIAPESEATEGSPLVPGRPGVSPLHVDRIFRVCDHHIENLRAVREATVGARREGHGTGPGTEEGRDDRFSLDGLTFEAVDDEQSEGVRYEIDERDRAAILSQVRAASRRADWVVATLHSHQGPDGQRNVPETPAFLISFAHECIDAGADAFVTTGPHVLRGMELYAGRPVFYSLGNFVLRLEHVDRFPPETYRRFGVPDADHPAELFDHWLFDGDELRDDVVAEGPVWETVVPVCRFEGGALDTVELIPCWLQETRGPAHRGIPAAATGDRAAAILERFASLSAEFDTGIERRGDRGVVEV
jgi:poly-gamma-glutamate capsule biosynthesis protein CapA/YwtB (metallophosphatase superfamily)